MVLSSSLMMIDHHPPFEQQYTDVQWERWETWKAFLRRIGKVVEYKADGSIVTHKKEA